MIGNRLINFLASEPHAAGAAINASHAEINGDQIGFEELENGLRTIGQNAKPKPGKNIIANISIGDIGTMLKNLAPTIVLGIERIVRGCLAWVRRRRVC